MGDVRTGFSFVELVVALVVVGLVAAFGLPRLRTTLDRIAVDAAAVDITTAVAVTRAEAVMRATRARLVISADTLGIDIDGPAGWEPFARWPGPRDRGVELAVSNPELVFAPTGIGWGASNTTVVLRRSDQVEKVTMSRTGRVKRW